MKHPELNSECDSLEEQHTRQEPFEELVARIQRGDTTGMEELYRLFSRGVRYYLCRQLGPQDLEDKVHDVFILTVLSIKRGALKDPSRLMGYIRTVARRQAALGIRKSIGSRISARPELDVLVDEKNALEELVDEHQKSALIRSVLDELCDRDREILTRFYFEEESLAEIRVAMHLSETQCLLLKSRAKARFAERGKKVLAHNSLKARAMRATASA